MTASAQTTIPAGLTESTVEVPSPVWLAPSPTFVLADVRIVSTLPPLAWLAEVSGSDVRLWCGSRVEVRPNGFFEGCWADDFDKFNFDEVPNVFGSGGKLLGDMVRFVPPSHTLEVLYVLEKEKRLIVSNSLPFLVEFGKVELDFDFEIGARFASILKGIVEYERVLFRQDDWTLYRITHEHIEVRGGRMTLSALREPLPFRNFHEYKGYLVSVMQKTFENGSSSLRKGSYAPIATCSSGYDSPAAAALAACLGCNHAVALRTARGGKADSGRDIAERLGMTVQEFSRQQRSTDTAFGEAEFLATGMGGEDYIFGIIGPSCASKIVVNGFLGGTMWQLNFSPTSTMVRKDCSGSSLTEHRLRHGFVLLPVPFIGSTHHAEILRIGKSAEMQGFRVGGEYDRPIPRRILEELNIPGTWFGQVKKGYSICFNYSAMWWSPTALNDLKDFERRFISRLSLRSWYLLRWFTCTAIVSGYYLALKICKSFNLAHVPRAIIKRVAPDFATYEHNHPRYAGMAFLWALSRMRSRYRSSPADHAAD